MNMKMNSALLFSALISLVNCSISGPKAKGPKERADRNVYDFIVADVLKKDVALEDLRGKVMLIVNVASECGFTDGHYKAMVHLQKTLSVNDKFTVLAFPCNQFGGQEPGSDEEIHKFATEKYEINFPLFSKVDVTETGAHPLWRFITEKAGKEPNWNFWKYLVNHEGKVLKAWGPWHDIQEITPYIKGVVDLAHEADPNTHARGPPQPERQDYGDGANGEAQVWDGHEGYEGNDGTEGFQNRGERAGTHNEELADEALQGPKPAAFKRPPAYLKHPGQPEKIVRPGNLPRNLHEDL